MVEDPIIEKEKTLTIGQITKMVSDFANIPVSVLKGEEQNKLVTCARYVCFHFIRLHVTQQGNRGKISYKTIGSYFNRHHTTVLTGKKKIKNVLFTKEEIYINLMNATENKIEEYLAKN